MAWAQLGRGAVAAAAWRAPFPTRPTHGQLPGQEFSIFAPTWTAPLLRAHRRAGLGAAGRHPWGWRRIQARRSMCLLLPAVQRRRVESLVLGAHSSSPVHRALVLVLGTNIAVLSDCSKSSRQCSLPSFLTYLLAPGAKCPTWYDRYSAHRRWPTASPPTAPRRPGRPIGGPTLEAPSRLRVPRQRPVGRTQGLGPGGLGKGGKRREGGNTRRDLGGVEGTHDQP